MKKQKNWEEKKSTAFYYSFKPRELKYFLFGKKRCPRCGGKLTRSKGSFTTKGALPNTINTSSDFNFIDTAKVKYYYYIYTCQECQSQYSLEELVI